MKRLFQLRFASLVEKNPQLILNDVDFSDNSLLKLIGLESRDPIVAQTKSEFELAQKDLISVFRNIPHETRKEIWLGHFIERSIWSVCGIQHVATFLRDVGNEKLN